MARILLIEEEAELRALIKRILECDGHTVIASQSLCALSDDLAKGAIVNAHDIIITDTSMADVQALKALRQTNPRLKIVATASGKHLAERAKHLELAERLGADGSLPKPFSVAALLEAVNRLLAPDRRPAEICESPPDQAAELRLSSRDAGSAPPTRLRFTSEASM